MSDSRKKVLIVVNYYYPYVSGVSEYARSVALALAPFHDVTVLTGRHDPVLPTIEKISGHTVHRAEPLFFLDKGYISIDFMLQFLRLQKSADIVNIHFPMLESGLLSLLTSKRILLTYQCDMAMVGSWMNRMAVAAVQFSGKVALKRAMHIAVLSKDYGADSPILRSRVNELIEISPPNRFEGRRLSTKMSVLSCGLL